MTQQVVRPVQTPADRAAAYGVRRTVFQDEQRVPPELEFDADDAIAVHLIAVDGTQVVGTGRVVLHPGYAKIGRMAVLPQWRKRGTGRALLEALLREAATRRRARRPARPGTGDRLLRSRRLHRRRRRVR